MDIDNLRTFLAVVKHRSFAAAGQALGLSRSGVSIQIAALESAFGIRLFDRSQRPPRLTPEGQTFLNHARDLMAVWARMQARDAGIESRGTLDLGAVQTVAAGVLAPALRVFRSACPDVRIRLQTGLADELDAMVRRGDLDAAVLPQSDNLRPGLSWHPFCREDLMVVAPEGVAGETDAEVLATLPFVRLRRIGWGLGRTIEQEFARRHIEVVPFGEVDSSDALLALVANGLCTGVFPRRRISQPFPPGVRCVPFGAPHLSRTLGVLTMEGNGGLHPVNVLLQSLVQVAEQYP